MKVVFLLVLSLLVLGPLTTESGRILRTWRRRSAGPGRMAPFRPPMRRSHYTPPWRFFRRPRTIHPGPLESQRRDSVTPFRSFPKSRDEPPRHGFPIQRDPTTHYAPPSEDEISLGQVAGRRSTGSGPMRKFRPWRRPPPPVSHISLWKLLTMKHRRRFRPRRPFSPPPQRPRPHDSSEEAEISPSLPNIVYFLPKDTLPTTSSKSNSDVGASEKNKTEGLKPGFVTDVPLYPTDATSASEFKPIPVPTKENILKVVDVRKHTLLQPSTIASVDPTQQTAPAPEKLDSTETLLHELLHDPPFPINSFNINIDPNAEGSDSFIRVVPSSFIETETVESKTSPPATSTTTKKSTSTTTTFKPKYAVRVIMPPADESEVPENTQITSKESSSQEKKFSKNSKESPYSSKEKSRIYSSKETKSGHYDSKEKKYVVKSEKMEDLEPVVQEVEFMELEKQVTTKAPIRTAPAYKWPTMKPYQKSVKKPIVTPSPKLSNVIRGSSITTSTSSSESTSISITGVRSKVKEYKPSVLATTSGLLVFDKVDTSGEVAQKSSTTTPSPHKEPVSSKEEGSPTPLTTVSPMQKFDPMKMIHSWLTKAKSS